MTATTVVHFEATTVHVEDEPRYRLYAACTAPGELPDTHIFLHEIIDNNNPMTDVFTRVLQVPDLDLDIGYKANRLQARSAGSAYWRSPQMVKHFPEVAVAVQAKQVLRDEVNRLIADYTSYTTQYQTSGDDVAFPTGDTATIATYTGAYDTAEAAYTAALAVYTVALAGEKLAKAEYDYVLAELDLRDDLQSELNKIRTPLGIYTYQVGLFAGTTGNPSDCLWFIQQVDTLLAAYAAHGSGLTAPELAAINSARTAFFNYRANFVATTQPQGVKCSDDLYALDVNNYYSETDSTLVTKRNTYTAAIADTSTARATVYASYNAMESAYEAAKEVCPSWIPDEPLPPRPSI